MTFVEAGALFSAAAAGGALNSVAGGGSFFTFPTLLFFGVPPVQANATSAVALWPGSVASVGAYRRELAASRRMLVPISVISLAGGLLGANFLLATPQATFRALVPWLLLVATVVFAFGHRAVARLRGHRTLPAGVMLAFQFAVSIYGGFFGGGMGILMLAAFAAAGMTNIHEMNGLKNWLAVCINGIAVVTFVIAGAVYWPQAAVALTGAIVGGYGGASLARRIDPSRVRAFVIVVGAALTGYFFVKS